MSNTIIGHAQEFNQSAIIELWELDLSAWSQPTFRFHNGMSEVISGGIRNTVTWQAVSYGALAVQGSGFTRATKGTLPRPHMKVGNVLSLVGQMCNLYGDLIGCKLTRHRTLAKYLDAVNFVGGNAYADSTKFFADEIYYVNQKILESKDYIEFELAASWDVDGVQLPRRVIMNNACWWIYRGDGCGYTGTLYFDVNDNVAMIGTDVCGHRLSSCKLRFPNQPLPFGGFPGAGLVNG